MSLSPEMLGIIFTAGGGILVGGVAWGKNERRQDDLEKQNYSNKTDTDNKIRENRTEIDKKIDEHISDDIRIEEAMKKQISRLFELKDLHDKDASNTRLDLQKQLGNLEGRVGVNEGNYQQILRMFEEIKKDNLEMFKEIKQEIRDLKLKQKEN